MNDQPQKLKIYLVDDHQVLREGLQSMINAQEDMNVIGQANHGKIALDEIPRLSPDVVVMDIVMPELNGIRTTQQLRKTSPDLIIVTLTQHHDQTFLRQVLDAGVSGYVLKQSAADILIGAIRTVAAGHIYIDPELSGQLVNNFLGRALPKDFSGLDTLTKREIEILKLIAWGHSNKEIADQLKISVKTVETHKKNFMGKLGLGTRADIVRYAVRQGWLQE